MGSDITEEEVRSIVKASKKFKSWVCQWGGEYNDRVEVKLNGSGKCV